MVLIQESLAHRGSKEPNTTRLDELADYRLHPKSTTACVDQYNRMGGGRKHLGNLLDDVSDDFIRWSGGVLGRVSEGGSVGRRFGLGCFGRRGRVGVRLESAF